MSGEPNKYLSFTRQKWAVVTVFCLTMSLVSRLSHAKDEHSFHLHSGWWNIEAEYQAPFGLFFDVGIPWAAFIFDGLTSGVDWVMAVGGKLGYEYDLNRNWSIRAGFRTAFSFAHGSFGVMGEEETQTKAFGFVEGGVRYQFPSGFFFGLDIPLFAFDDLHELFQGKTSSIESFYPPFSFAFSQCYMGYSWGI
jgi:hypothetical protein